MHLWFLLEPFEGERIALQLGFFSCIELVIGLSLLHCSAFRKSRRRSSLLLALKSRLSGRHSENGNTRRYTKAAYQYGCPSASRDSARHMKSPYTSIAAQGNQASCLCVRIS